MDAAAQDPASPGTKAGKPRPMEAFLAGLQAGMLGVLWMLAWMGLCAAWLRRSFWTPENLLGTVFHPDADIATDFATGTIAGLALYLLVYSLIGGVFAMLAKPPLQPPRRVLLAVLVALGWYYFSFHLLWKTISPSVAFLNPERPAVLGHVIYGLVVGRFHSYLPKGETPVTEVAAETETKIPTP